MLKTLKFRPHLVTLILSGEKTTTWRLFDDKDLQAGDKVEFLNSTTKNIVAHAVLTKVYTKPLGKVEDVDYAGHEKYENADAMLAKFREYYGDRVNVDTVVKIIHFKLN